ncbi:Toll/interleukin-1 receptor domain-containing protein, partial [Tanacetum coccineum]
VEKKKKAKWCIDISAGVKADVSVKKWCYGVTTLEALRWIIAEWITPNLEMLSLSLSDKLAKLCMPAGCQKLNYIHITYSKLRTFDLGLTPNLETLSLSFLWLRSLDLELIPNLETLDLQYSKELVEINPPVGCLKKVVELNLYGCAPLEGYVPLEDFKALQGISGPQRFQIHKAYGAPERLPSAHTCFNQLDLPEYTSKE